MVQQHGHRAANSIRLSTKQAHELDHSRPLVSRPGWSISVGYTNTLFHKKNGRASGTLLYSLDGEADAIGTQGSI